MPPLPTPLARGRPGPGRAALGTRRSLPAAARAARSCRRRRPRRSAPPIRSSRTGRPPEVDRPAGRSGSGRRRARDLGREDRRGDHLLRRRAGRRPSTTRSPRSRASSRARATRTSWSSTSAAPADRRPLHLRRAGHRRRAGLPRRASCRRRRSRPCRARLERRPRPRALHLHEAVDDIAEVLRAYGYRKQPLRRLLRHARGAGLGAAPPGLVRTMILRGRRADAEERDPLHFARAAQNALDALFAECAGDADCARRLPRSEGRTSSGSRAARRARRSRSSSLDPASRRKRPLRLSRHGFAQTIRYMLYMVPMSAALLLPSSTPPPRASFAADRRDRAAVRRNLFTATADGFYLSATCPEDVRFIREEEIGPRSRAPSSASSASASSSPPAPRGAARAPTRLPSRHSRARSRRSSSRASAIRSRPRRAPTRSRARSRTPKHIVVADATHGTEGMQRRPTARPRSRSAFFESGKVEGLDVSCVTEMRRPPFILAGPAPTVVLTAAEARAARGPAIATRRPASRPSSRSGESLRIAIAGNPPLALRAVSKTRFEPIGLPPG